jgi:hypothetical protein
MLFPVSSILILDRGGLLVLPVLASSKVIVSARALAGIITARAADASNNFVIGLHISTKMKIGSVSLRNRSPETRRWSRRYARR